MERLVLGVIAIIVLHIAFVIYTADVLRVDQDAATALSGPAGMPPRQIVGNPRVDTKLQAAMTAPAAEIPSATPSTELSARVRSRSPRVNSTARFEVKGRRRPRPSDFTKPIGAYAFLRASPKSQSFEKSFGDHVVVYETETSRPTRNVTVVPPAIEDDDDAPQPKKSSLIAKLQFVYKKPWALIKAVGSKLR